MFKLRDLVLEWNEFESLAGYLSEPPASIHPNPPHFLRNLRPPILQNLRPPFHCGNFGLKNVNWDFLYFHCMPLKKNVGKLVTLWNIKNTSTLENIRSKFPQCIHRSLRPSPTFLRNLRLPFVGVSCHRLLEPPAICWNLRPPFLWAFGSHSSELQATVSLKSSTTVRRRLEESPAVVCLSLWSSFVGASGRHSSEPPVLVHRNFRPLFLWNLRLPFIGVSGLCLLESNRQFVGASCHCSSESPAAVHRSLWLVIFTSQKNFLEIASSLIILLGLSKVFSGSDL